jgi:thiol-disulfide isomerase/thioredoxin
MLFALLITLIATNVVWASDQRPLPEFTTQNAADWLNSQPLTTADLRGRVVLVDIWTFGCWNCYRSFPWLNALEDRLADRPFSVIGIHSPEFDHERDRSRVLDKMAEFSLRHPVMLDNDFAFWRALNNRYWPAFYLVDKQGVIRYVHVGETHEGDARAIDIERQLNLLLDE